MKRYRSWSKTFKNIELYWAQVKTYIRKELKTLHAYGEGKDQRNSAEIMSRMDR